MITWKDVSFACIVGLYSLATTRLTVGLPLNGRDDFINAAALFIAAGIGGVITFRANPQASLLDLFKPMAKPVAVLFLALGLTGCSSTNIAEVIKSAAQDPATICATASGMWGGATFLRSATPNGKVSCNGLTLETSGTTSIPVTVVPQATQSPLPVTLVPQPSK